MIAQRLNMSDKRIIPNENSVQCGVIYGVLMVIVGVYDTTLASTPRGTHYSSYSQ